MTSRLTMEIQGVPYDNIEPLREYLMQAGLEMGGTGSKKSVRLYRARERLVSTG